MRRVESVIDTWYDSGAMPFAQFHYPFENEAEFEERFPADYICEAQDQTRGWFYTLLAESTLLFGESSYRNCVCLGLILDPEGQKMSKSRGNVVDPWEVISAHGADAFRWYYLTAQQPWAGYRFSVDTVGESVRQFLLTLWNTYSFWVLYANAEDFGPLDFAGAPGAAPTTSTAGRSRACRRRSRPCASGWTSSTAPPPGGRSPSTSRSSPTGTCGSRGGASGTATAPPSRPCATACWRRWRCWPPSSPSSPTRSTSTSPAACSEQTGEPTTRSTCATSPRSTPALADPDLETGMEAVRLTVELGRAARAQAKAKVRQPLRRAVIVANDAEREAIEARAGLVTAELNVKELDFVSDEGELVSYTAKPNYRSLGPRFGKRMPQVAAAVEALDAAHVAAVLADGGEIGIAIDGNDHTLGPDESPSPCNRSTATRSRPRPATPSPCSSSSTTSCAARVSPARSSTPSRSPAKRPASKSPTASPSPSAATPSCSPPPGPTSTTSPARCWPPPSPTTRPTPPRPDRRPRADHRRHPRLERLPEG